MHRAHIYIILLAIIATIIYAYYIIPEKPEKGIYYTPKEYIEQVEKKKAERRKAESTKSSLPASN